MTTRTARTRLLAGLALSALALSACGSSEDDEQEAAPASATPAASASSATPTGPITVTDARGKAITLEEPADDVVVLEWGLTEQVVSLGVMPEGVADKKGYGTWVSAAPLDATVKDVGTRSEPSVDAIAQLDPDLVIAADDSPSTLIAQLEKLSPVVVVKGNVTSDPVGYVKQSTELLGAALGKAPEATALNTALDEAIAESRAKLEAAGKAGTTVAFADGYKEGSAISLRLFTPGSLWGSTAVQLGLQVDEPVKGDPAYGLGTTDVEGLTKLAADTRLFYLANDQDGGDVFGEGLTGNPVYDNLPFVKQDRVTRIPDGTWSFGGPRSLEQIIAVVTSTLTA